jgi:FmdE, Molybdenum formylmethanofuran dehydrogenase operon
VLRLVGLRVFVSLLAFLILPVARSETPEQWVALLARVHGGFGAFLPVGTRIGEDAMKRLNAKLRELDVTFYQGEGTPCPCAADGVSLAVYASAGRGTLHIAPEKSPPGTFAVVIVKPRKGGEGLKYTVPMSVMLARLGVGTAQFSTRKCDILFHTRCSPRRGRSHEATGIHQAYWRGCSGMAAYGARPGYQEAAADRQAEFWFKR